MAWWQWSWFVVLAVISAGSLLYFAFQAQVHRRRAEYGFEGEGAKARLEHLLERVREEEAWVRQERQRLEDLLIALRNPRYARCASQ